MSEFDLTEEDIQRLYGKRIYLLPDDHAEVAELESSEDQVEAPVAEAETPEPPKLKEKVQPPAERPQPAEEESEEPEVPGIHWRPKADSQVLFVLHQKELKDKALTELLKKIVESIGIPFDAAGFGIIKGEVGPKDWAAMPNPYAVVFDQRPAFGDNPTTTSEGEIFFTTSLQDLQDNQEEKRALWSYLKTVKESLEQ